MPTLTIRNVPAEDIAKLKARAKANNRSLEAELREIVAQTVRRRSAEELLRIAEKIAARSRAVPQTDSAVLLRADRDR